MTSPRKKFVYAACAFILVGLAIIIALVETQQTALIVAFFVWIMGGSFLLMRIRCPNCGVPVAYQGKLGSISIYAGFVRSKCQNCDADLTKE